MIGNQEQEKQKEQTQKALTYQDLLQFENIEIYSSLGKM